MLGMLARRIEQHFIDSADLKYQAAALLSPAISAAVEAILACVTSGGKVLACGDGESRASAQQFVNSFIGRYERDRPELAALVLSASPGVAHGQDGALASGFYARQVRALGQAGDVLLVVSTTGKEQSVLAAVEAAHEREMVVVVLSAGNDDMMALVMRDTDILINIPHVRVARILEVQVLVVHCLCDGVDVLLLGDSEVNP